MAVLKKADDATASATATADAAAGIGEEFAFEDKKKTEVTQILLTGFKSQCEQACQKEIDGRVVMLVAEGSDAEILAKVNDLFDGELSDDDRLVYVNHVKGKLLESDILVQQASNNSKGQFDNSPDLDSALTDAIIDAFGAYTSMSKQALDSERVRAGLKAILLGPAQLYEALRERAL